MQCPNNKNHTLRPSKENTSGGIYLCDECEGFACWHVDDLRPEDQVHVFNINEIFLKKIDSEFDMPLPFSFRIDNETGRFVINTFSIVTGDRIGTKDIHLSTFRIIHRLKQDLENQYGITISWA